MNSSIPGDPSRSDTIFRLLFVLIFALAYSVAEFVLMAIVIGQFGFLLIAGDRNNRLQALSESVGDYLYEIIRFVSFRTDERPFPFGEWPDGGRGS